MKATTWRRRIFSFEGTRVSVVASILKKWDAISLATKHQFIDASYEGMIKRLRAESDNEVEKAWRKECVLSESLEDLRKINLSDHTLLPGDIDSYMLTRDPSKLRDAANTLEKAAKKLRERAESIESRPSPLPQGNEELRVVLVKHWVRPDGVCLCWLSYPALKRFLLLTCPKIPVQSVEALRKECERLGLPKLNHPLVEERQIRDFGKGVSLAGSS